MVVDSGGLEGSRPSLRLLETVAELQHEVLVDRSLVSLSLVLSLRLALSLSLVRSIQV